MKTKLISTVLRGTAFVDPRFSASMLKWIITDIKNHETFTKISIGIENEILETYNIDFELQFKHEIKNIIGMCLITSPSDLKQYKISSLDRTREFTFMQINGDTNGFVYLYKLPTDPLLHIYLYECDNITDAINLLQTLQNYVQLSYESVGHIPQNIISKSSEPSCESLKGILLRNGIQTTPASNLKNSGFLKDEKNDFVKTYITTSKSYNSGLSQCSHEMSMSNSSTFSNLSTQLSDISPNKSQFYEVMFVQKVNLNIKLLTQTQLDEKIINIQLNNNSSLDSTNSLELVDTKENTIEENGIIVLLIGEDLRFISPDRKQILLCKSFNEILNCEKGSLYADHFIIIFRSLFNTEVNNGYLFKCQTKFIVDDIISNIGSMMLKSKNQNNQIIACDSCPMLWYHNLCVDLEGLNDKKINAFIRNQIEKLTIEEQKNILTKYNGADDISKTNVNKQNQFLMMLLRAHCEYKNERHIHDLEENKIFFTQALTSRTFFMKAKRSLTNSFDHLLKRKDRKVLENNNSSEDKEVQELVTLNKKSNKLSPISNGNLKEVSPSSSSNAKSWRQEILQRVVTPSKNFNKSIQDSYFSPFLPSHSKSVNVVTKKRSNKELRELWGTGIRQVILLLRMEKENAQLQAKQNENEMKRVKLEYEDICPCSKSASDLWEEMILTKAEDRNNLLKAIKDGVPRHKRGDIWLYLTEQDQSTNFDKTLIDVKFPNFHTPYKDLLKSFTEHQHAIFIDLGRTFPNHKYFKQSLGVGQLSLFNLLKAYSILDPEVGYCQGLGFICGILLLHLDEEKSFEILKYLMFNQQLRLKYLPEMQHFQLQLYQLSRLIKDHLPDLYDYLEKRDISTTLYAAPWILTIFSSQFSLGFVTRVFDFLFLEPTEIIFKVSLALLILHKNNLLKMETFEDVIDYIKNNIPRVSNILMTKILRMILSMELTTLLNEYQIEYNVLQEELKSQTLQMDILEHTKKENESLALQLETANLCIKKLEEINFFQKNQIDNLQQKTTNYEITLSTLQYFLNFLIEYNNNMEITIEKYSNIQLNNIVNINSDDNFQMTNNFSKEKYTHVLNLIENILNENDNLPLQTITILDKIRNYLKINIKLEITDKDIVESCN